MLTKEDLELTEKYMSEYTRYCQNTECGEGCPVFVEHKAKPKESCFRIYCRLREIGALPAIPAK